MTNAGPSRGRRGPGLIAAAAVVLLAAGCSDTAAPPPPPAPAPTPSPAPFTVPPPLTEPTPTVVIATDGPRTWTMPNLVGSDLQDAQDAIQALTAFEIPITTSHDETGAGREQLVDRNWKVCSQSVPAGEAITRSTRIDFGAVKDSERC
jgi:PASTA domain